MKQYFGSIVGLLFISSASAQMPNDVLNLFGGIIQSGITLTTQSAWQKLPPKELLCVDQELRRQGTSINLAVRQGIGPSDSRVLGIRATCRDDTASSRQASMEFSPTNYTVVGMALGGKVSSGSIAYSRYACAASEQFPGFDFCRKKTVEREARGAYDSSVSILHADDGTVAYVNRSLEPAFFAPGEAEADIARLSKKYGAPETRQIPPNTAVPFGMIVSWGKISLEPVEASIVSELAAGRDVHAGFLVDFLSDFHKSARLGLPIYRIGGGSGFVWAASWGTNQRGTLRFLAANASFYDRSSGARLAAQHEADRIAADKAAADKAAEERALEIKTAADRAAAARLAAETEAAEQAAAAKAAAEKAAADRAAAARAAADRAAVEKAAADKAAADEAMRRAEKEIALEKEAKEKGTAYASSSGVSYTTSKKKNEMTDGVDTTVRSVQKNEGVAVEITGECQQGVVVFSGLVVDRDGKGVELPGQNTELRGAPVLYRINDLQPTNRILPALEYSNKFELLRLSGQNAKAQSLDDVYRMVGGPMGIGAAELKPRFTWRVMVEFKTGVGTIIAKLPLFNDSIQELIGSCIH